MNVQFLPSAVYSGAQPFSHEACNKAADGAQGLSATLAGRLRNKEVFQHEALVASPGRSAQEQHLRRAENKCNEAAALQRSGHKPCSFDAQADGMTFNSPSLQPPLSYTALG